MSVRATLSVEPAAVRTGQSFAVTMLFTNLGGSTVTVVGVIPLRDQASPLVFGAPSKSSFEIPAGESRASSWEAVAFGNVTHDYELEAIATLDDGTDIEPVNTPVVRVIPTPTGESMPEPPGDLNFATNLNTAVTAVL